MDEAIGMASAVKIQGIRANLQLDDLNDDPLGKTSDLIPIRSSATSFSSPWSPLMPLPPPPQMKLLA